MSIQVGVIRGNGIGPEITEATIHVLEATGLDFQWVPVAIGDDGMEQYGHPLPQEAVKTLKEVKLAIKAPLLVDKFKGRVYCEHEDGTVGIYPSLNNAIRRELELYVCPRPIRGIPGISGNYEKLDVHIMREITEDVYSGIEHMIGDEAAECIKLTTKKAALRVAEYAFDYARRNHRSRVTCVHKANAVSMADGLFLKCFRQVAAKNPDIPSDDFMIDASAYYLAKNPEKFDVIVASNQYGDILSDLAAGLVGSLGLAPGANVGEDGMIVVEASHGAAPDIAGKGIANPIALILSGALLLRHIGEEEKARLVEESTVELLSEHRALTPDLGGTASTMDVARAIAERMGEKMEKQRRGGE
ncbi:MAG: isocitrate/isopropylmalate dehydrogenase family protein [Eubacteriales bacterium]|nr:isocitrate/isopropylmalate dehydrogenase family protein [Eubacteriales bacterium]